MAVESIAENLNDVAGIRAICPFISDIYAAVSEMLQKQGRRSPHRLQGLYSKSEIQRVPQPAFNHRDPGFFFCREGKYPGGDPDPDGSDFWASLEHQIRYKNDSPVVRQLADELKECADIIAQTDVKMQELPRTHFLSK